MEKYLWTTNRWKLGIRFVEWTNGDTSKLIGVAEHYVRDGVKIVQKIDGTERLIEVNE